MQCELRTTLALCAITLLIASPFIFAPVSNAGDTYLPMAFSNRPTLPPSATPTLTPSPTVTPLPTNTPGPTNTPVPLFLPPPEPPCDQNAPVQFDIGPQAWMTVTSPSRFSFVTVCARYTVSGGAVTPGAILDAVAHYRTTDTALYAIAGADGVAHVTFNIGSATPNYTVVVDGTIRNAPFSVSFTPH